MEAQLLSIYCIQKIVNTKKLQLTWDLCRSMILYTCMQHFMNDFWLPTSFLS